MTETTKREHPEMRNTVFGQVLTEILEARDFTVTPANVGKLAEDSGADGWAVISRTASIEHPAGPLDGLADALELTYEEMDRLALANAYEERRATL